MCVSFKYENLDERHAWKVLQQHADAIITRQGLSIGAHELSLGQCFCYSRQWVLTMQREIKSFGFSVIGERHWTSPARRVLTNISIRGITHPFNGFHPGPMVKGVWTLLCISFRMAIFQISGTTTIATTWGRCRRRDLRRSFGHLSSPTRNGLTTLRGMTIGMGGYHHQKLLSIIW